jgi:mycothione reductase
MTASTNESSHFDLVILGAGSGNSIVGPEMDDWRIALVEESTFGGTCLNRGCIPTKIFVHAADTAEVVRHASHLGIDASIDNIRWADIRDRVFGRIDPIAAGGEDYRSNRCPNITVFKGHGTFVGERTIRVNGQTITADRVVVAVGARPRIPIIDGLADIPFHTSDSIMRVDQLPKRLVVIGGGFIASEMTHVFASFGTHVTMVVRGKMLLGDYDHEVAGAFTDMVAARPNVDVLLHRSPRSIRAVEDGSHGQASAGFELTLDDGSVIAGDQLLIATGRIPNSDSVGAEACGLAVHDDGRIVVDEFQRTTVPGVWALGDVSSPYQLKHVANHETRVVRHNLLNPDALRATDHRFVPAAVFTRPQIATVGMSEQAARDAGLDVMVKTQRYGDVAFGWAMEDTTSICKLVADRQTRKLVGAHLMGPQSSTLIQTLIQAMTFGQTIDEMANAQYWIHPALPEVIENALLGLA